MLSLVFPVVLVASLLVASGHAALIATPMGHRRPECILEVPSGARVEEHPDGTNAVLVTHPDGSRHRHVSPDVCAADEMRKEEKKNGCDSPPCTCDTLPCNNWIDNAGSMNTTNSIGGMSAVYVTPGTPPSRSSSGNQTLFFFIGAENTNGTARGGNPAPGRAILQPVLTFDPTGWCRNSTTGWCFASWYCCPKHLTVHSSYVQNVRSGDAWFGQFNLTETMTEYITSGTSLRTGETSSLVCPAGGRNFNWADVTQEVYKMASCHDFAVGEMGFLDVKLWNTEMMPMSPNWLLTTKKPCDGRIKLYKNNFWISHNGGK